MAGCVYPYRHVDAGCRASVPSRSAGHSSAMRSSSARSSIRSSSRDAAFRCGARCSIASRIAMLAISPLSPRGDAASMRGCCPRPAFRCERVIVLPQGRNDDEGQARYNVIDFTARSAALRRRQQHARGARHGRAGGDAARPQARRAHVVQHSRQSGRDARRSPTAAASTSTLRVRLATDRGVHVAGWRGHRGGTRRIRRSPTCRGTRARSKPRMWRRCARTSGRRRACRAMTRNARLELRAAASRRRRLRRAHGARAKSCLTRRVDAHESRRRAPDPGRVLSRARQSAGRHRPRHARRSRPRRTMRWLTTRWRSALDETGDKPRAIASMRRAIECDPDMVQAHRYLGTLLLDVGDADRRDRKPAARGGARPERMPDAWNNLGTALHHANRLADAETAYRRALALKPDYPRADMQSRGPAARSGPYRPRRSDACARASPGSRPTRVFRPASDRARRSAALARRARRSRASSICARRSWRPTRVPAKCWTSAMVLAERGDHVQARKAYAHALRQNPRYLRAALAQAA